ncbi:MULTISPECIES: M1 family aminopeptidase [unclassified Lentimicrobium]|uniref:M1 family aminopeptidase n=1 Tax=unclassified Lentimicrobium TaxID=2677434 RepID=UPI001553813B|nr:MULTISPECIES: M1 family aminopeptidase [unclassified Lentimicrobium]NPD47423.1 T9SS type A sorting domain-containing protein [Lentimicrobium sp. S6]NPD85091.1 T9SS type A sorting domain-containing protein [Lentimicrobium sp. L6]
MFPLMLGGSIKAQLPLPEDFCHHAKSGFNYSRTTQIDYSKHDLFDIHFYYLNLALETNDTYVDGKTIIQATSLSNIDTIHLELTHELEISKILVNQLPAQFIHQNTDIVEIICPIEIPQENNFEIEIQYNGTAISDRGRGYNTANSYHGTRVNWTLSEPFYSKDWWPCKQDLEDKADSVWVFVTTSNKNKVGSNGLLTNTVALENEKVRYEWKSRYPIAYYLISIALAEYMEYSFYSPSPEGKEVWMLNYLYPDSAMYKAQKTLIDCTHVQMNLLQEKYGSYPFIDEKYGHCISPIGGGMEHQTMTTQRDFQFHLTIHEMGHSWFGNQVTCAQWNDIWINEGFATYTQYLGLENLVDQQSADAFNAAMQSVVMREPDGSVYVPDEYLEDRDRIFSGRLSYYKGAVIIQMIRYLLEDDELFFYVLQEFQTRFAYQTATGEDFKEVLEELSQQNFEEFFNIWYYGEGYPIYNFNWQQIVSGKLKIESQQESSTPKTEFFPMKYDILLFFEDGTNKEIQVSQEKPFESFEFDFVKRVSNILPNPRSQNLMDVKSVNTGMLLPEEVSIEPNPATSAFILRFANANLEREIEIYNSSLQIIETQEAPHQNQYIECHTWARGIYFIKVKNDKKENLKKLVKF